MTEVNRYKTVWIPLAVSISIIAITVLPVTAAAQPYGSSLSSAVQVSAPTRSAKKLPYGQTLQGKLSQNDWLHNANPTGTVYKTQSAGAKLGNAYAAQYKLDAAEAAYQKALSQNPNDAAAHHGLGWVAYLRTTSSNGDIRSTVSERYNEAIQHTLDALRLQPNFVSAQLTISRIYLEQHQRLDDAKYYTAQAYALQPNRSDVLTMVGRLMLNDGDTQGAIDFLSRAKKLNSRDHAAYYWLGKAYAQNHDFDHALAALNTSVWLNPNNAPAYHVMGQIYHQQGNQAGAVGAYQRALLIKPEYLEASTDLAALYQSRHDWPQAMSTLKNAYHSILKPWQTAEKQQMALDIADMALENRQPEVAQVYYNDVLQQNPNHLQALKGMSAAKTLESKLDLQLASGYGGDLMTNSQSHENLKQALIHHRGNIDAKLVQTKLYGHSRTIDELAADDTRATIEDLSYSANDSLAQGELWTARFDAVRAERSFETALRSAEAPEDRVRMGDMLLTLGQPRFAQKAFKPLVSHPSNTIRRAAQQGLKLAEAQQQKAEHLLLQLDKTDYQSPLTEDLLLSVLQADQRNVQAHWLLGELYRKQDNRVAAIRHYHVFKTLAPYHPEAKHAERHTLKLSQDLQKISHQQKNEHHG